MCMHCGSDTALDIAYVPALLQAAHSQACGYNDDHSSGRECRPPVARSYGLRSL